MAHLSFAEAAVDFNSLLQSLELTKGNLSTHIKKLEDEGLGKIDKRFIGRKPRTSYRCTKKGKKEVQIYLTTIESGLKASS